MKILLITIILTVAIIQGIEIKKQREELAFVKDSFQELSEMTGEYHSMCETRNKHYRTGEVEMVSEYLDLEEILESEIDRCVRGVVEHEE